MALNIIAHTYRILTHAGSRETCGLTFIHTKHSIFLTTISTTATTLPELQLRPPPCDAADPDTISSTFLFSRVVDGWVAGVLRSGEEGDGGLLSVRDAGRWLMSA